MNATALILYFAYGSNLLAERFFINNDGKRIGVGKITDFALGFNLPVEDWQGNVLTVVPKNGSYVMGAVWEMTSDVSKLDDQEYGYFPLTVNVQMTDGRVLPCRTYQLIDLPSEEDPEEHLPSYSYLKAIVKGAMESKLPKYYIKYLKNIKHNGVLVQDREELLQLQDLVF